METLHLHFWKKNPFVKIVAALVVGILIQWYFKPPVIVALAAALVSFIILLLYFLTSTYSKYKLAPMNGVLVTLLFMAVGGLITFNNDISNKTQWLGHHYKEGDLLVVTIKEPLVEKTKSFKTIGEANYIIKEGKAIPVSGKLLIYFNKDSVGNISYGHQIVFKKPLQEIKNAGNPGGFDFKQYSHFQGITHQVYLKNNEVALSSQLNTHPFWSAIYSWRVKVLSLLRKNITSERELGLAEALLIGYKNDLEQSLVQSYTNTGVVHIIAISGLHLGLIYWLLGLVCKPLLKRKNIKWLRPIIIITSLWAFSFLAGAQPSILRSAVMFTCIVLGDSFGRKSSIFNTLSLSAFILLCINPFWLWDVGFQLSYAAVLSIIVFMQPIYNWIYCKNKLLDFFWKMNAVTLSAQILTLPFCIYHFHQFPTLFFLSNFLAVPLSSAILLGEILVCLFFWMPKATQLLGYVIEWLIRLMNTYIEKIESIPFSLWDGLLINIPQAVLLLLFGISISYWLMQKSKTAFSLSLLFLFCFMGFRSYSIFKSSRQQKLIVYNVPRKTAIDFINGSNFTFLGDSDLVENDFVRNFHLKPSRILHRINNVKQLANFYQQNECIQFGRLKILWLQNSIQFQPVASKQDIDVLIVSKNPKLYIKNISQHLHIKQVVFDGSVPAWKTKYWKKDCDSLHIPWHDVSINGAFVMPL
jgi:competence protein ComEC